MINIGLKISCKDTQYTEEILSFYNEGVFQYIELFTIPNTYNDTISYWKQFNIPFGVHAPHSVAGLNLADKNSREKNVKKIEESIKFADILRAEYIIFHSGVNGNSDEVIKQLKPFADERFLIENKPIRGIDGSFCVGCDYDGLNFIIEGLGRSVGFCLDFGHAICAANSLKIDPFDFIKKLKQLKPRVYHLTDGNFSSELDSHLHYGEGSYPLGDLVAIIDDNSLVTNEAKRESINNLNEVKNDTVFLKRTFLLNKG
ncbi:MAG: sugar phosphate isomerase/epimerase [Spirochaetaceae bacterium]|nr:sugar phosphate isomerase/epimerase [Treponema sp.]MBP3451062.1 sugar phosphate isomerase/epimerase [Spirochaetaceae bacterium]